MAATTTVKVHLTTRDLIKQVGEERHWTADQLISAGVEALRREQRHQQASREALEISADHADLAEMRCPSRSGPASCGVRSFSSSPRAKGTVSAARVSRSSCSRTTCPSRRY